jgi:hypothetical protein
MKKPTGHFFSARIFPVCAFAMLHSVCIHAANPIITSTYTADPSPHQWSDGTYYMYCSHDQDADVDWNMVDYHVFSSTDLVNWIDNGIAFKNTDSPFGNGAALWAPDCMYRNGLYYLYYPQNSAIGVATSVSPTGPFTNARKLYQTANSQYSYDPMIFVDDDNQAYLLVSSCMNPNGAFKPVLCKLGSDMMSITQETILATTGNLPARADTSLILIGSSFWQVRVPQRQLLLRKVRQAGRAGRSSWDQIPCTMFWGGTSRRRGEIFHARWDSRESLWRNNRKTGRRLPMTGAEALPIHSLILNGCPFSRA